MKSSARLLQLIWPHWPLALLASLAMGLMALTSALYAYLAGPFVRILYSLQPGDAAALGKLPTVVRHFVKTPADAAVLLAIVVVVVTFLRAGAYYVQRISTVRLGQLIIRDLRLRLYDHLQQLAPSVLVDQRRGDLAARLSGDVGEVQQLVGVGVAEGLKNLVSVLALGSLAFYLDGVMASIALAGLPLVFGAVTWTAKLARAAYRKFWDSQGMIAGRVGEVVTMQPVIRTYSGEALARDRFFGLATNAYTQSMAAAKLDSLIGPTMQILGSLALAAVMVVAGVRLATGTMTVDAFVSSLACVLLMYRPMQDVGNAVQRLTAGTAALDRIEAFLETAIETVDPPDAVELAKMSRELVLEDVYFSFGTRDVLRGVTMRVAAGESVAIVGLSGEGKTTLLRLLVRLLEPSQGTISIDGFDVSRATRRSVRAQFAWVPQEPLLFADTVLANIALGDPQPCRTRVEEAARGAGAHDFVSKLDDGYDTVLAENGAKLSAGQRQRLCIARAIYRDAPVLLLDEPTASLDGPAVQEVSETIESLLHKRTVVLASHRLSTVKRAHRVIVLWDGRVVQDGSPDALSREFGAFRSLFYPEAVRAREAAVE